MNNLGPEGIKVLSENFKYLNSLEELILGFNSIKDKGVEILATFISDLQNLIKLDLGNNLISTGIQVLADKLENLAKLEELYLTKNNFSNKDAEVLFNKCKRNKNLQIVDISRNLIDYDGVVRIAMVIKTNKSIQSISLADCLFKKEYAEKLQKLDSRFSV